MSVGTTGAASGLPQFSSAAYTITTADNRAAPGTYYAVNLVNSSDVTPALPTALLGDSLTITGGATGVSTNVVLPGGAFSLTAAGNISIAAYLAKAGPTKNYLARQGMQMGRDGEVSIRYSGKKIFLGGRAVTCVEGSLRLE